MSLETGGDHYEEVGEEYWSYHSNQLLYRLLWISLHNITLKFSFNLSNFLRNSWKRSHF